MKQGLIVIGSVFAVALAVVVGNRLSSEATAVLVGAICGISASIPITLAVVIASSQNWGRVDAPQQIGYDYGAHKFAAQPPVIVVAPPHTLPASAHGLMPNALYAMPPTIDAIPTPRDFRIIGNE